MPGDKIIPLVSWDSCLFLAWFKGEKDKPLGLIEDMILDIKNEKTNLLVSAIVGCEVLDKAGECDAGTQFRDYVKRSNVIVANVDMRVAEKAASMRERAVQAIHRQEITKGIKAPDAVVAATASLFKASVLYSFDSDLVSLSGSEVIDKLKVVDLRNTKDEFKLIG